MQSRKSFPTRHEVPGNLQYVTVVSKVQNGQRGKDLERAEFFQVPSDLYFHEYFRYFYAKVGWLGFENRLSQFFFNFRLFGPKSGPTPASQNASGETERRIEKFLTRLGKLFVLAAPAEKFTTIFVTRIFTVFGFIRTPMCRRLTSGLK